MFSLLVTLFSILNLNPALAIQESHLRNAWKMELKPFLIKGEIFRFKTHDQLELEGIFFRNPKPRGTIVVLTGFTEPYLKYTEVFFDLYQQGYSIISYDHRGQGLSPHLSQQNPQVAHCEHFSDYTDDFQVFMDEVVKKRAPDHSRIFLLAHSMGGAIALSYLELDHHFPFQKAFLNAPMLSVKTDPYPQFVALALVKLMHFLGKQDAYAPGSHDYDPGQAFEVNRVTSSRPRYDLEHEIQKEFPSAWIGGPSNGWVEESLITSKRIRLNINKVKIPLMMITTGKDEFVNSSEITESCMSIRSHCTLIDIPLSKHETLMEQDRIRDEAFRLITQ
jgi:lysophospholipase